MSEADAGLASLGPKGRTIWNGLIGEQSPEAARQLVEALARSAVDAVRADMHALSARVCLAVQAGDVELGERFLDLVSAVERAVSEALLTDQARRLVEWDVALCHGDLDRFLELCTDAPDGEAVSRILPLIRGLIELRASLSEILDERRAHALVKAMLPLHPSVSMGWVMDHPWMLTPEIGEVLERHLTTADEDVRLGIEHVRRLIDGAKSIRSADEAGRKFVVEAIGLSREVRARVGTQDLPSLFRELEKVETPALEPEAWPGVEAALRELEVAHASDVGPHWLAWCAVKRRKEAPEFSYFAGLLSDTMRPVGNVPAIAAMRLELSELALHVDSESVSPTWFANTHHSCARSIAIAFDLLGKTDALARRWLRHATLARDLAFALGDADLVAMTEGQILAALRRAAETATSDLPEAVELSRRWVERELDETPVELRAARRAQLAKLLLGRVDDAGTALDEARAQAKVADSLLGNRNAPRLRRHIDLLRATIEIQRLDAGLDGEPQAAVELCESVLPSLDVAADPDGSATAVLIYSSALGHAELPRRRALSSLERVLATAGGRLSREVRAGLLLARAQSHGEDGEVKLSHPAYQAALRDIEEAADCFAGAVDVDVVVAEVNVHARALRLNEAIACLERAHTSIQAPHAAIKLHVLETMLWLQRDQASDRQKALTRIDTWLSAPAEVARRSDVRDAILYWLSVAISNPRGDYESGRAPALASFARLLPEEHSRDVALLTGALAARTRGQGVSEVASRLAARAASASTPRQEFQWLRLTLYFALGAIGPSAPVAQAAARQLETHVMGDDPAVDGLSLAIMLVDLATARLSASEQPSLVHAEAALRLLERIKDFINVDDLPDDVGALRLRSLWFASLRRMGLRRGQSAAEVVKEADRLLSRARANVPDSFEAFVDELCHWLSVYPAVDSQLLRLRARQIAEEHGLGVAALRDGGTASESALERGERRSELAGAIPRSAEEAIIVLEPLLETERERWRVQRALGRAWLYHPGRDRSTMERALTFFGQAARSWPPADEGCFVIVAELGVAVWQAAFVGVGHAQRAEVQSLIEAALLRSELPSVSKARAMLLASLAQLEEPGPMVHLTDSTDPRRQIDLLEQAVRAVPNEEGELRFGLLVTLGNARKRSGVTADLEAAVKDYRMALGIADRAHVFPLEVARGKKCLADALCALGGERNVDEAQALLHEALVLRPAQNHPELRAEALLSLAKVEIERPSAVGLPAARDAVLEAESLVDSDANPSLALQIAKLRHLIESSSPGGCQTSDATGLIRPARIGELFVETARASNLEIAVSNPRSDPVSALTTLVTGELGRSALGRAGAEAMFVGIERARREGSQPGELDVDSWADDVIEEMPRGETADLLRVMTPLVLLGQLRSLEPAKWRPLMDAAKRLVRFEAASDVEWSRTTLLRGALLLLLLAREGEATIEDWEVTVAAIDTAVHELEIRSPDDPMLDELRNRLGVALFRHPGPGRRDRWKRARALWQGVVERARKSGARVEERVALINCGALLTGMGVDDASLFDEAIRCYDELLDGHRDGLSPADAVKALSSRGWARSRLSISAQPSALRHALDDLVEALELTRKHALTELEPGVEMHLGIVHSDLMSYEDPKHHRAAALQAYDTALAGFEAMQERIEAARTLHNRGDLLIRCGDPDSAVAGMHDLTRALALRAGRTEEELETLQSIMTFRSMLPEGSTELGEILRERIEDLCARSPGEAPADRILRAQWFRILLASEHDESPMIPSASTLAAIDTAIGSAEILRESAPTLESELTASAWLGRFGAMRVVCGAQSGEPARELLNHSARTRGRSLMRLRASGEQWDRGRLADDAGRSALAGSGEPGLARLEAEAASREADAAKWADKRAGAVSPEALTAALARRRATAFVDITVSTKGTTVVLAFLENDALVLETRLLSVNEGDVRSWLRRPHGSGRGWLDILEDLGKVEEPGWLPAIEAADAELTLILLEAHQRLLGPALRGLRDRGVDHLVVSLQGPLATIPIGAAAHLGSDGRLRHLIEDFESFCLVPGIHAYLAANGKLPSDVRRALIVAADPKRGLPGLEEDTEELARRLRGASVEVDLVGPGDEQDPSVILRTLRRCDTAWLICHGSFNGEDLRSCGVLLESGKPIPGAEPLLLTCEAIMNVEAPLPVRLVVLASCQAGRTRLEDAGGEWLGISGALLRAGVQHVIAALWDVSYASAVNLVQRVLDQVIAGADPDVALCAAMRSILSDARSAGESGVVQLLASRIPELDSARGRRLIQSPLFWAAFQVLSAG